jgi:pyruvate carboxylase
MRSLGFSLTGGDLWNQYASLCCACGLCTLYSCPELLYPKEACDKAKSDLKQVGIKWSGHRDTTPHPMYEGRRTPLKQLMKRLDLLDYDHASEFSTREIQPARVELPLIQHIGAPAQPVVDIGESVKKGQCVGEIPEGKLGARVHASIDGVVKSVKSTIVIERK